LVFSSASIGPIPSTTSACRLQVRHQHPKRFKRLNPQSVEMRTLASLVEQRRRLVDDRVRLTF
jgi:hypothetical protein